MTHPTDAMVQKVARALFLANPTGNKVLPWERAIARNAIAAYEAALNEAGLVVVPREPTEEMMRAAIEADEPEYSGGSLEGAIFNRLRTEYCAMLAAASPAPKDTKEEE